MWLLTVVVVVAGALGLAQRNREGCDPVGEIQFICDVIGPEDFAVVPGAEWIITSGDQEGGRIQLVNVRHKTATPLFPTPTPSVSTRRPTRRVPVQSTRTRATIFRSHPSATSTRVSAVSGALSGPPAATSAQPVCDSPASPRLVTAPSPDDTHTARTGVASSMRRATRQASSGGPAGRCRWVVRACPSTRHARRSDTRSRLRTWNTAGRRRGGLRSFPRPPL